MIQNFIVNTLVQNSECDNIKTLNVNIEDVGNLITRRNLFIRVDVHNLRWAEPVLRLSPTIYTRGLRPYKNPPLSYYNNKQFRNKTSITLDVVSHKTEFEITNSQSDFERPIQFLIDWAQKYGAYEGYFVYNRESSPWVVSFEIKKNQWIRDEERIDKVKNLEIKLKNIKSNSESIKHFISGSTSHKEYQGYHNMIEYYTKEIDRVTYRIKNHKRLLGMNVFRI
jgi:hypothetical protein